jgi:hypothetical protein
VTFSFKGETCELDAAIDLDCCLGEPGATPDVHPLLARAAGIDPDSYLHEGLESHEIELSDATGARHEAAVMGGSPGTRTRR